MSSRREKRFWSRKRREKPPIDDLPVVRLTSFNIPSTTVDCPTEACSGYNNAIKPVITTHRSDPTSSSSGIFGTKLTHHSKKSTASRLSIHSLLYPSSVQCTEIEARTKSRSVHDLVATRPIWDTSADESNSDRDSMLTNNNNNNNNLTGAVECVLCFEWKVVKDIFVLIACDHRPCGECMKQYAIMEVTSSRVELSCPACSALVHPGDVYRILADERDILAKYEKFSVRRALMLDADTRWCPAPDCGYAVIASGCAGCPMLICRRDSCDTRFCYHCKEEWHANQTCDQARLERHGSMFGERLYGDLLHVDSTLKPGDIKSCPRCHTPIVKMQDGSCNHMVCALCHAEFCWLCMKEISDLHYLSPSGCTFWGKKPWSRKKKLFWQLGTLIGAPVGIGLIAGLAVPAIIFGVPIWVGRKIHQRLRNSKRVRHHFAVTGGVVATVILSPVLATMAVGVGVPIMLAYVYGVVPLSLCRNGTCGVSASSSGVNLDINENAAALFSDGNNQEHNSLLSKDLDKNLTITLGDNSTVTGMSIQSGTSSGLLVGTTGSFGNRLQVHADIFPRMDASTVPHSHTGQKRRLSIDSAANSLYERVVNYEEASTKGLAGSTCCDDKSIRDSEAVSYCGEDQSTRALAGSLYTADAKSVCGAKSVCSEDASVRALAGSICYDGHSLRGTDTNFDGTSFAQQRPPIVEDPLPSGGSNSIGGSKASSRERLYVPCASATQFGSGNHATNPNVPQKQIKFVDQCDEYTHEGDKCTRCRVAAVESDMPDGRGGASIGAAAAYNVKLCYDCSKSLDGTNSEAVDGRYLLHPVGGKIRQPSTSSYMEDDEDYDETLPEIRKSVSIGGLIQQGCGARTGTAGAPVKSRKKSWRRGSGILSRLRRSTGGSSTSFDEIAADSNEFSAMMNVIPGLTLAVPVSSRLSATLPRVSGGAVAHFGRLAPAPVAQRRQTVPFNTSTAASSSEVPSAGIIEQADVAASGRDRGASFLERMSRNRNRYASLPEIEEAGDLISYSLSRLSGLMK